MNMPDISQVREAFSCWAGDNVVAKGEREIECGA